MKVNRFSVLASSLVFVAHIYANGAYQRTDDRKKTFVWNNDPQPGDTATWSGDRDAEGYATGPGTLTWSRINKGFTSGSNVSTVRKKTPISSYSGTMVRGKFDGGVTTVERGKSYHAKFVDGQRKENWVAGPLISKAEGAEPATTTSKPPPAEPAKPVPSKVEGSASTAAATPPATKKISEEKKASGPAAIETNADIPAAGPASDREELPRSEPAEEKPAISLQQAETSKLTAETQAAESSTTSSTPGAAAQPATLLIAQASTEQPDESATPRQQPVTRKTALAPGAVRAVDRPPDSAAKKIQSETAKQTTRAKAAEEKTKKRIVKPAPSQPPPTPAQVSEEAPTEEPPALTKEEIPPPQRLHSTPSSDMKPAAKEPPVDDSIRTLTGPPAALKTKPTAPEAATSPPAKVAPPEPPAASPPPQSAPKLTAVNAMDIADIEARTRGYDVGEYQLPKAEYNAANDTWSVSYTGRDAEGRAKKFNVVVQDKSGKAEVKK